MNSLVITSHFIRAVSLDEMGKKHFERVYSPSYYQLVNEITNFISTKYKLYFVPRSLHPSLYSDMILREREDLKGLNIGVCNYDMMLIAADSQHDL